MSYIGGLDPERGCKAEVNLLHHDGLTLQMHSNSKTAVLVKYLVRG